MRLTAVCGAGFNEGMGRKPLFDTSIRVLINKATLERIQAVLRPKENRLELVREAVEKELRLREGNKEASSDPE